MSGWLEKIKGAPLRWQFAALLVTTQIVAQAVTMSFTSTVSGYFGLGRQGFAAEALAPFVTAIGIAERIEGGNKDAVLAAALAADPRLFIQQTVPFTKVQTDPYSLAVLDIVEKKLPKDLDRKIVILPRSASSIMPAPFLVDAAYSIDGKRWLVFSAGTNSSFLSIPILVGALTIALLAFPLACIAVWIGSSLISPMVALANGAERFSRNLGNSNVPETGPKEVKALAQAFNVMRTRIRKLVDDRSQMLAAVSHDMRTPLTRLRLRIESVEDTEAREAMIEEVKRIDGMINSALTFLRTQKETVKLARVDVAVLARTITDEHADMGEPVVFTGANRVTAILDKELFRRAIENLIQNAVTHGGNTEVSVHENAGFIHVCVADDGDGFGDQDAADLVEPFKKGNQARNSDDASKGFGLGLAITKSIAELHDGSLLLSENNPRGVLAQIILPALEKDGRIDGKPNQQDAESASTSRQHSEHNL